MIDNNEKFRESFEKSPIGILFFDKEGNLTDANKAALEIGRVPSLNDIIGINIFNVVDIGPNMDKLLEKEYVELQFSIDFDDIKQRGIYKPERSGIDYIDLNISAIDSGFLVQIKDITERKKVEESLLESEEKYKHIIEFAPTGIYEIDFKVPKFMSVNDIMCQIMGYTREELMKMSPMDILSDKSKLKFQERIQKGLSGEKLDENVDYKVITKNGREIWANLNVKLNYKEGKLDNALVIAHDITERKKVEEDVQKLLKELKKSRDYLEEKVEERTTELEESNLNLKENEIKLKNAIAALEYSNQELKSFAYITSHDLQEPLRTIASFTQLLERRYKGQLDADADEFMDYIVDAAKRMKDMIQGLLEYSRVDRSDTDFVDSDMNLKVEKALSNLNYSVEESKAEITYNNLPTVCADPNQMIQIFQNLISNAIKFKKPQFPPRVHISSQLDIKNKEWIFSVEDNGIGMDPQYSGKIFEVFRRLHTIDVYEGTGIGLAVVKRIIEHHGGRIWVKSELGKGSVFYFALPVEPVETGGGGILKI